MTSLHVPGVPGISLCPWDLPVPLALTLALALGTGLPGTPARDSFFLKQPGTVPVVPVYLCQVGIQEGRTRGQWFKLDGIGMHLISRMELCACHGPIIGIK